MFFTFMLGIFNKEIHPSNLIRMNKVIIFNNFTICEFEFGDSFDTENKNRGLIIHLITIGDFYVIV